MRTGDGSEGMRGPLFVASISSALRPIRFVLCPDRSAFGDEQRSRRRLLRSLCVTTEILAVRRTLGTTTLAALSRKLPWRSGAAEKAVPDED